MNEKLYSFHFTAQGSNHIKANKVCEDYSGSYDDENINICVVADGHGSDNYPRTDKGSKFAVEACISQIKEFTSYLNSTENSEAVSEFLSDKEKRYPMLSQLAKSILNKWHEFVEADYTANPFTKEELESKNVDKKYRLNYINECEERLKQDKAYGTTLIAFAVSKNYCFGLQIGDGKCVAFDENNNVTEPIPWDENCQLNVTTSICDNNAIDEFRYYISKESPAAVFCGSDGIDDSYAGEDDFHGFYGSIMKIFAEHGKETCENEIKEYLPILSKKGSGDDVSIAAIFDVLKVKYLYYTNRINAKIISCNEKIQRLDNDIKKYNNMLVEDEEKIERLQKGAIKDNYYSEPEYKILDNRLKDIKKDKFNVIEEKIKLRNDLVALNNIKPHLEKSLRDKDYNSLNNLVSEINQLLNS